MKKLNSLFKRMKASDDFTRNGGKQMKAIIRGKWAVLLLWMLAAVVLMMTAPNMGELVREKGQITVPDGYSSSLASELLKEVQKQEKKEGEMSAVLVFHRKDRLQEKDWKEIEKAVEQLQAKKNRSV